MPVSLHQALIPSFVQILKGLIRQIDKAEAHVASAGADAATLIHARLAPDMFDFAFQVKSASVHSLGAIDGVRRGWFSPDRSEPPATFDGLRARLAETIAALEAIEPDEIEAMIGRPMEFRFGEDVVIPYDAEEFLLSFSQPNFYFHVSTAYALMRGFGVPLGKPDYLGPVRKKKS